MQGHQTTVRSACSWHWMWSILENRYEHCSWWTISFSLLFVHIRFASLHVSSFFFFYSRLRRWVFSQATSPCSLLCWKWYRRQEISLQRSRRGPKPEWPWVARSKVGSKMITDPNDATWLSICSRSSFMKFCHPSTVLIWAILTCLEERRSKRMWFTLW